MFKNDAYNQRILCELKKDGRISNSELAEIIGLSPSACLRRVQEMENCGLIKGYRAVFDSKMLDVGFVAYVGLGLGEHSKESQDAFERAIAAVPEVKECHNVTGTFEYLIRVETKNIESYKSFHADGLGAIPQVSSITTWVVMDSPKDERA